MIVNTLSNKVNNELSKAYAGVVSSFIQVGPEKWLLPEKYISLAENYKNFDIRPSDVWITGYCRSGTTMTQDICWLLTHNLDFPRATQIEARDRVKLFEYASIVYSGEERKVKRMNSVLSDLVSDKEQRVIKTHLPFSLLPPNLLNCGSKVVYVSRNVKDVAVSFYNLQKQSAFGNKYFTGTFQEFWNYIENDLLIFNPYWKHLKQGFAQKDNKNVLFIFYEEQRRDLRGSIKKIAKFLEKELSEDQLDAVEDFMSFSNYKKIMDKQKGDFVRKGQIGGWKEYFTKEQNAQADKWIEKNLAELNMMYSNKYEFL